MTLKLGVLISGRGSNLLAILASIHRGEVTARVSVVISNNPLAPGLELARAHGVTAITVDPSDYDDRATYEYEVVNVLLTHGVQWVVLAGYMKLLGKTLLGAFKRRIINIHPSLLPSFKGLDAQRQALEYGVKIAGCTVHVVTAKMDDGPILDQAAVPVLPDDTVATLSARILAEEHRLLPKVIQLIASGQTNGHSPQ